MKNAIRLVKEYIRRRNLAYFGKPRPYMDTLWKELKGNGNEAKRSSHPSLFIIKRAIFVPVKEQFSYQLNYVE